MWEGKSVREFGWGGRFGLDGEYNSGSNDHCIVEITPSLAGKNSDMIISTELSPQVNRGEVSTVANTTPPTVDHSSRWVGIISPSSVESLT